GNLAQPPQRQRRATIIRRGANHMSEQMAGAVSVRPSRGRWYILLMISAMYLITYLDRVNISTAAPLISKEFGFDKVTMGFIFSAFVWAYAAFQVPGGWLSDKFGARGVLASIVAYWSVMTAVTAGAFNAASSLVVRFVFGLDATGAIKPPPMEKQTNVPWGTLLRSPNMWAIMAAYFTYVYCLWIFLSWLPSYLVDFRHFTLLKVGLFASLPLWAGVVGDTV